VTQEAREWARAHAKKDITVAALQFCTGLYDLVEQAVPERKNPGWVAGEVAQNAMQAGRVLLRLLLWFLSYFCY
jgi:hypothetical protein